MSLNGIGMLVLFCPKVSPSLSWVFFDPRLSESVGWKTTQIKLMGNRDL
jgi:hypothetical protein